MQAHAYPPDPAADDAPAQENQIEEIDVDDPDLDWAETEEPDADLEEMQEP